MAAGVFFLLEAAFLWLALDHAEATPVLIDEFAHIPAGVSYWESGRFHLYRENPPLVRYCIGLPAWLMGARVDYSHAGVGRRSEWAVGRDYINANPTRYPAILRSARLVTVAFALACGALMYWWGRECYGPAAAACTALWLLDPSVLAFSAVATTDVAAACVGLAAAYATWRFLRSPSWSAAAIAGAAIGAAQGAKFSLLVLYPVVAVLVAARASSARWRRREGEPRVAECPWTRPAQVVALFGMSLVVLNALYLFDGSFRPLGSYTFRSALFTGRPTFDSQAPPAGNRFLATPLADLPVPLPRDYVLGFDSQKWEEELGFARLSDGRIVHGGAWHTTLSTFLAKRPAGTLAVLAAGLIFAVARPRRLELAEILFLAVGLSMLGLLSTQVGLNWIDRYTLPALPFLALAAGPALRAALNHPAGRLAVFACLGWNVASLAAIRPDYFSYANELAGGPAGAVHRFLGSNYDWGQDLGRLKVYLSSNPQVKPVVLSYYGVLDGGAIDVTNAAIPDAFLPASVGTKTAGRTGAEPFYWIISANLLKGLPIDSIRTETTTVVGAIIDSPALRPERAVARVGYSLYLFQIVPRRKPGDDGRSIELSELNQCLKFSDRGDLLVTP